MVWFQPVASRESARWFNRWCNDLIVFAIQSWAEAFWSNNSCISWFDITGGPFVISTGKWNWWLGLDGIFFFFFFFFPPIDPPVVCAWGALISSHQIPGAGITFPQLFNEVILSAMYGRSSRSTSLSFSRPFHSLFLSFISNWRHIRTNRSCKK